MMMRGLIVSSVVPRRHDHVQVWVSGRSGRIRDGRGWF